jgi:hypothetical protein
VIVLSSGDLRKEVSTMSTEIPGTSVARIALRTRALALSACAVLWVCGVAGAQILKTGPDAAPQKLMITILDGDGALNNIRQRDAREPIVQVTDENHKPVAGALVLFTIHGGAGGANATFEGAQTLTVRTGTDGIAHATGIQVAHSPGSFTVSVTATATAAAGVTVAAAQVLIHQSNFIGPLSTATSASGASSASSTTATHGLGHLTHIGHLGHAASIATVAATTAAVAAAVVVVVVVNENNSTSLTLGTSTVGHP